MTRTRLSPLGLLALATLLGGCGSASEPPTRVVFVTLDTWRGDAFGPEITPELDRFAARGRVWERHYTATSTTQPTHASLFTGQQPWTHGVTRNGMVLAEERTTLAEHLASFGFSTHAVVSSFPLEERFGFAQGFDVYEDDFDVPYVQNWEGEQTEAGRFYSLARSVTDRALAALDAGTGAKQFFWFHYFDPHDPYGDTVGDVYRIDQLLNLAAKGDPGIDAELARARERYDRDVTAMDVELGRLFARLAQDADRVTTHVLITADHGESFGEAGALGHGKRVTREQVEVPLVLVSPSVSPGRDARASGSADVAPTLLAALGLPSEALTGPNGGRNLLSADSGQAAAVYGMRRSFAKPKPELLTDGTRRALPPHWFFRVERDELIAGNAEVLVGEDDPARPLDAETPQALELRRLFAGLAALVEAGGALELVDPATQDALNKLGYAR